MRISIGALALALLTLTIALSAGAEAEPDTPKKDEAKTRFLHGLELVQNEQFDAALAEFLLSNELYPTRVALKNTAITLRQLQRYVDALERYEELLRKYGSALSPEEKKITDDAILQLRTRIGELSVESQPSGAKVVIDGQQRGTTPLTPGIRLATGTHTVRVTKEGFETQESQVVIASAERKPIRVTLQRLNETGTLIVREAEGRTLAVVVDGAEIGKTPSWQGTLAVGSHSVFLRGPGHLGTAPSSAEVTFNGTSTLSLRAVELDGEIRVEPTPSNARVHIDGVPVGNGVWEGRLQSGTHKVEISASGFIAFRGDVRLKPGRREVVRLGLERDLSDPVWRAGFVPHLYAEVVAGGLGARGFGAGTGATPLALGLLVGARGGYQLTPGLGVELFLGYATLSGKATRSVDASGEGGVSYRSNDFEDHTRLSGPLAAVSASYRFFEKTPLTVRVWAGVARGRARFENSGTFEGDVSNPCVAPAPPACASTETYRVREEVAIPEQSANVWLPFVGPEVRIGYRLSKHVSVDLGVLALFVFAPDTVRTGDNALSANRGERKTSLEEVPDGFSDGNDVKPGVLSLSRENGLGTFVLVSPNLALRYGF